MNKLILALLFLLMFAEIVPAQTVQKTMLRLPDTGQTSSYTNTFGEDSDFLINPPTLIDQGNGIVTDSVTGLLWQKVDGGEMSFENAVIYCNTLTLGGYSDWRLPNAHEAFSMLNLQNANPALNTSMFTNTGAEYWWTSDRQANDSNKIWVTNSGGGIGNHLKTETISAGGNKKFHVRAVRYASSPQTFPSQFVDNGNGTVTDVLTQLIWQKSSYSDTLTWEQSLAYADTLSLGGISEWRLPNIKELQSINDEKRVNPSLNSTVFSASNARKYWSSTTLPNQTTKAWYLSTQFGITTYDAKNFKHYVLCVSANPNLAGIHDYPAVEPLVYPNPFHSALRISQSKGSEMFVLTNSIGQIVYQGKSLEDQDFSGLAKGVYVLCIIDNTVLVKKLIKE